jgi:3-phenylpropionate/trans-cinnamate dioxygenase ferredoxin reductase subunit
VRPVRGLPSRRRVESVANALEQAGQVASALCGRSVPRQSASWFWSDQYDTTIQIAGFHDDADTAVVRRDPSTGHFAVFHLKGARLTAVEAVGSPREAMAGRRWLAAGACPDRLDLADPAVPPSKVRMAPHIANPSS